MTNVIQGKSSKRTITKKESLCFVRNEGFRMKVNVVIMSYLVQTPVKDEVTGRVSVLSIRS
jgi:hypothetical protein